MSALCSKDLCTGCLACVSACRRNAIEIVENGLGFKYPRINEDKCVHCGVCTGICHICSPIKKREPISLYTYKGNREERLKSSSGAFFPLAASYLLERDYTVCGVIFKEDYLSTRYILTKSKDTVQLMRKSKYVEAELGTVFESIKSLIDNGNKVLFVGLPCHVAALLKIVPRNENLLTIDLICHGSGSPELYKRSILSFLEKKNHTPDELTEIDFRHKPFINDSHTVMDVKVAGRQYTISAEELPYYYGFVNRIIMRESCFACRYNSFERVSDLTIGDTLGHSDVLGENIVFVNTEQGRILLEKLKAAGGFSYMDDMDIAATRNRFCNRKKSVNYEKIIKCKRYSVIEKKYLNPNYISVNRRLRTLVRKLIQRKMH